MQAILESLMDSAWQTIRRSDRKPLWFPFRQQTEHTSCRLSDGSDFRPEAFAASFQTKRIQNISKLSPARIYYVLRIIFESSLPERSFVLHAFRLWKFCILHIFLIKTRQNETFHFSGKSRFLILVQMSEANLPIFLPVC